MSEPNDRSLPPDYIGPSEVLRRCLFAMKFMHRIMIAGLLVLFAIPALAARTPADIAFEREFGDRFLDAYWQLNPDAGIYNGYYNYADELRIPNEENRAHELKKLQAWNSQLQRFRPESLSPSVRTDWELLKDSFEGSIWELTEYRSWEWDPSAYNVAGVFGKILSTEYAPLEERLRAVSRRLANVPGYYAAAKKSVKNPTREHTQLAIEQSRGALTVFGDELLKAIRTSKLRADEREILENRVSDARAAIEDYVTWLTDLEAKVARSGGRSFRLGPQLYEKRFAYSIRTGVSAQELYQAAIAEKEALLARMALLTDILWPKYFPNNPPPQDRLDRIGQLVAELSKQHVAREEFMPEIERQIPELEKWIIEHRLLDLDSSKPLQVRTTPPYQRGVAAASVESPGPYDPGALTYYNVLPLDDLAPERAESFLREYNRWMLPVLNIHEAVPGHYVQLVYANKSPNRIKSIFGNGAMVEGWAVYAERMMLESGYGEHTAEAWLIYSKWNLRSVSNAILDYGVHVLGMTEEQAEKLLTRDSFQSAEEARGKWRRVQLTSVQLTSYFAGYSAIYGLRERLKREWGDRFDLKRFHEQFLSYGNSPINLIGPLMIEHGP